ncbi:MAG: thermonuclease family protein [Rhodospirillales bacterium]|nr:thermonuclease family protein [Rhodospirillales bacterium]
MEKGPFFKVIEVVDGDTVRLEDGRQVRLVGLQAPKLPLGRKGFKKWPLADESKKMLENLCLNRQVQLHFGGTAMDRHSRILAHLITEDGTWIQGEMLRQGMARVYTFPDNRSVIDKMLKAEKEARHNNRGIWQHPFYRVRSPENLYKVIGTFQVVEGVVRATAFVKGTIYLNYGADWRKDFTVKIKGKAKRLFKNVGLDPLSLKGKRLRVRGWLKKRNGPLIEATHPEQIEVIE